MIQKAITLILLLLLSWQGLVGNSLAVEGISFSMPIYPELADPGTQLRFSITCHVEPLEGGKVPDYRDESYFKAQVQSLRKFTAMLEKHGAKLTLQVQRPFTDSLMKWDNLLPELEKKGHEIGTHFHEDHWVKTKAPKEERLQALREMKASVDQLGVHNVGLCGGWQWSDIGELAYEAGYRYMDNYKNAKTQLGLDRNHTVFPYRMKGGPVYIPEGVWLTHRNALPPNATAEDFDRVSLMVNFSLVDLVPDQVCTANLVMHLSDFTPRNEEALINLYDAYLGEVLDPVVRRGLIQYSTISESGQLYEEENLKEVYFLACNKAMPDDPKVLQQRGVTAIERLKAAAEGLPSLEVRTLIEPVVRQEDYQNGKAKPKVSQALLWEELNRLSETITDQDTVILYTHTHGKKNQFSPNEPWGGIRLDSPPLDGRRLLHQGVTTWPDYMEQVLRLPAKTVVVMVMSCYSGGLLAYLQTVEDQWSHRAEEGRNFIVLTSQNAERMSNPVQIEGETINAFTFAVEQAFQGEADGCTDGKKDGEIDINEWIQYITETTMQYDEQAFPMSIGSYQPNQALFSLK